MAITGNSDINRYAISKFRKQFGENGSYKVFSAEEVNESSDFSQEGLFSRSKDFQALSETARLHPTIHEIELTGEPHLKELISVIEEEKDIIPIFIKDKKGELKIITTGNGTFWPIEKGSKLVYLGQPIDNIL